MLGRSSSQSVTGGTSSFVSPRRDFGKRENMTIPRKGSAVIWSIGFCLLLAQLGQSRPQNVYNNRQDLGQFEGPISNNLVRKDFFILEIPEEAIEDEIEEQMNMMMEKRWKQQLELDRLVLKLYGEYLKREREGNLNAFRISV